MQGSLNYTLRPCRIRPGDKAVHPFVQELHPAFRYDDGTERPFMFTTDGYVVVREVFMAWHLDGPPTTAAGAFDPTVMQTLLQKATGYKSMKVWAEEYFSAQGELLEKWRLLLIPVSKVLAHAEIEAAVAEQLRAALSLGQPDLIAEAKEYLLLHVLPAEPLSLRDYNIYQERRGRWDVVTLRKPHAAGSRVDYKIKLGESTLVMELKTQDFLLANVGRLLFDNTSQGCLDINNPYKRCVLRRSLVRLLQEEFGDTADALVYDCPGGQKAPLQEYQHEADLAEDNAASAGPSTDVALPAEEEKDDLQAEPAEAEYSGDQRGKRFRGNWQVELGLSITASAARWLVKTYRPDYEEYMKRLVAFNPSARPTHLAFSGPLDEESRAKCVNELCLDIRHLAALTYAPQVSDANLDFSLNIRAFRLSHAEEMGLSRWEPVIASIASATADPVTLGWSDEAKARSNSSLLLPNPTDNSPPRLIGTFVIPDVKNRPRVACPLSNCHWKEDPNKGQGFADLFKHCRTFHQVFEPEVLAMTNTWDILLINVATGYAADFKKSVISRSAIYGQAGNASDFADASSPSDARTERKTFALAGDEVIWIVLAMERPLHPALDALHQALEPDLAIPPQARLAAFALASLAHLLESNKANRKVHHEGLGFMAAESVVELFKLYDRSASMLHCQGWNAAIGGVLRYLASSSQSVPAGGAVALVDRNGRAYGNKTKRHLPMVWKTVTLRSLPASDIPELSSMEAPDHYYLLLVYRRTRRGGLVLIDDEAGEAEVEVGTLLTEDSLARYEDAGRTRYAAIVHDLGGPAVDLLWAPVMLNGLPANSATFPTDLRVIKKIKGFSLAFTPHTVLAECDGTIKGKEVILSLAGFEGFLVDSSALADFFSDWKCGWLVYQVDFRRLSGLKSTFAGGTLHNVWLPIPPFVRYIKMQALQRRATEAMSAKGTIAVTDDEISRQDLVLLEVQLALDHLAKSGRPLSDSEKFIYDEVLKAFEREHAARDSLKSARNVKAARRASAIAEDGAADGDAEDPAADDSSSSDEEDNGDEEDDDEYQEEDEDDEASSSSGLQSALL